MSDTDEIPKDEALLPLQEAGRLVAANLNAAVLDIMATFTPSVADITMSDPATVSVPSVTARTYKSSGRVLEFEVDDDNPIDKSTQAESLFKKKYRPTVGSKDVLEFIKSITMKQGDPYKEINTSYKDPDSLKNNLSLAQRLCHTEAVWKNNDLLDPCFIRFPTGKGIQLLANEDRSAK